MFNSEPANLKKSLKDRLNHAQEKKEEVEDAEETQKFINKIMPLNFADYKDKIELDMQNSSHLLNSKTSSISMDVVKEILSL